jgi:tetratricopeptide (TPR) repeat protein
MKSGRALFVWLILCASLSGQTTTAPTREDVTLVQQVFTKLLAVPAAAQPIASFDAWPPRAQIVDPGREPSLATAVGKYNAFANAPNCIPQVRLTEDLMTDIIQGDPDRLALILGHELGHLLLGHYQCTHAAEKSRVVQAAYTRDQEFAADKKGMQLALAAGFSARNGLKGLQAMASVGDYSSFEGLSYDHPSWAERLARLDGAQAELWKSMSAFQDGVYFLETEDYPEAEPCFRGVTVEFPQADDAWANLGYTLLMQYADKLTPDDLRSLAIGQVVAGAFYSRPVWLSGKVRGVDAKLWGEAVAALNEAARLNPNLALVQANLGVAYLLRPTGKDTQRAIVHLENAAAMLKKDPSLAALRDSARTPFLAVANNLAVAYAAADRVNDAGEIITSVAKLGTSRSLVGLLQSEALDYNYSMLLAATPEVQNHKRAVAILEDYLREASASSSWWPIAYRRYSQLCRELSLPEKTEAQLQRSTHRILREIVSVQLHGGQAITLGQKITDLPLPDRWQEVSTVGGTKLHRLRSATDGVDVLADADRVLAIFLRSTKGPALPVRGIGMETKTGQLRVGMSVEDVDKVLPDQPYRFESLTDTWVPYRFYPFLGVAMQMGTDGAVQELVVVQTARR